MSEPTRPRHSHSDPDLHHPETSPNLTVAGPVHLGDDRTARHHVSSPTGKKQKICCSCGKDVAHEERFKDRAGHYWCMECGVQENRQKHTIGHAPEPVTCPACSQSFPPEQMVQHEGLALCPACAEKRTKDADRKAARQAAREAAAIQEGIEAERRHKRILIITAVLAGALVLWAVYAIMS